MPLTTNWASTEQNHAAGLLGQKVGKVTEPMWCRGCGGGDDVDCCAGSVIIRSLK
jgi:hypothetical protein